MKTYDVLMTTQQYITVKAESAKDAEMIAWKEYRQGMHPVSEYPEFVCDECDATEEDPAYAAIDRAWAQTAEDLREEI